MVIYQKVGDSHVRSDLVLRRAIHRTKLVMMTLKSLSAGIVNNLAGWIQSCATHNKPTMNIAPKAIFFLMFMFRRRTTGMGIPNMKMSPTQDSTPLVSPIVISGLAIQRPPSIVLSQKYCTGLHSNSVAKEMLTAHSKV